MTKAISLTARTLGCLVSASLGCVFGWFAYLMVFVVELPEDADLLVRASPYWLGFIFILGTVVCAYATAKIATNGRL